MTRPYGRDRYRLTEQVYVAYYEDTERPLLELRRIAAEFEQILDDPAPNTCIVNLGENAITPRAEFWIEDPRNNEIVPIRSNFRRSVKRRFDEEGIILSPRPASCSPAR